MTDTSTSIVNSFKQHVSPSSRTFCDDLKKCSSVKMLGTLNRWCIGTWITARNFTGKTTFPRKTNNILSSCKLFCNLITHSHCVKDIRILLDFELQFHLHVASMFVHWCLHLESFCSQQFNNNC